MANSTPSPSSSWLTTDVNCIDLIGSSKDSGESLVSSFSWSEVDAEFIVPVHSTVFAIPYCAKDESLMLGVNKENGYWFHDTSKQFDTESRTISIPTKSDHYAVCLHSTPIEYGGQFVTIGGRAFMDAAFQEVAFGEFFEFTGVDLASYHPDGICSYQRCMTRGEGSFFALYLPLSSASLAALTEAINDQINSQQNSNFRTLITTTSITTIHTDQAPTIANDCLERVKVVPISNAVHAPRGHWFIAAVSRACREILMI